jgi:hypothetical protein
MDTFAAARNLKVIRVRNAQPSWTEIHKEKKANEERKAQQREKALVSQTRNLQHDQRPKKKTPFSVVYEHHNHPQGHKSLKDAVKGNDRACLQNRCLIEQIRKLCP